MNSIQYSALELPTVLLNKQIAPNSAVQVCYRNGSGNEAIISGLFRGYSYILKGKIPGIVSINVASDIIGKESKEIEGKDIVDLKVFPLLSKHTGN